MSCLFGMKRVAEQKLVDGTPAASVQKVNVPVNPVGLINNGSDCFVNSAVQILYAIPEFWEFLNSHRTDYVLDGDHGPFSIPGQFMRIFEEMQRSGSAERKIAVNPQNFREFVCRNSENPDLRAMLSYQQDSGEFLKLLLEHFQYYTKYHLDLVNLLAQLLPSDDPVTRDLLKKEFVNLVLCDISDFNNTELLSFDFFIQSIDRRLNELRLKISKAELKNAYQLGKLGDFAKFALLTKELIQKLGQQEAEAFFGKISDLVELFMDAKKVCDLFHGILPQDEGNLLTLQACFGESKDYGWLKDKVGYLNFNDSDVIYLNNPEALTKILDVISERIRSQDSRSYVEAALSGIRRNILDFRGLFCALVSEKWQVYLELGLPLDGNLLNSLIKSNSASHPICDIQDLLNLQNFTQANLPEILIVQPQSKSDHDLTLPNVGGFKNLTSERLQLRRHQKFPLTYQPSGTKAPLLIGPQGYKLIGMIYHTGPSLFKGHYIAACKYGDKWKIFDDKRIIDFSSTYINGSDFKVHVAIYRKEHNIQSLTLPAVAAAGDPAK